MVEGRGLKVCCRGLQKRIVGNQLDNKMEYELESDCTEGILRMGCSGSIPHMSSFFWWLSPVRSYSFYKTLYPKRRI